jgi:hypothetical protein
LLRRARLAPEGDLAVLGKGFAWLDNAGSRQAFLHTVRAVIEPGGQRVSAHDRLALAALLPTLIVWGERDSIIPATHGAAAQDALPGSRLEIFPDAGHMPHDADPRRFAKVLTAFCESTPRSWPPTTGGRRWATSASGGEHSVPGHPTNWTPGGRACTDRALCTGSRRSATAMSRSWHCSLATASRSGRAKCLDAIAGALGSRRLRTPADRAMR